MLCWVPRDGAGLAGQGFVDGIRYQAYLKCIMECKCSKHGYGIIRGLWEELGRARVDASGGSAGFYDSKRRGSWPGHGVIREEKIFEMCRLLNIGYIKY